MKTIIKRAAITTLVLTTTYIPATFANTLYQHCDYKGYRINLPVGNYDMKDLQARGMRNDDLSSLSVSPGYEITVYEHHHFGGKSLRFRANDKCLVNNRFNDTISSVKVKKIQKPAKATIYQHCDYKGYAVKLPVGRYDLADLQRLGVKNDDLSAISVAAGYEVFAYQHHHFAGRMLKITGNNKCLVNNNFNDTISSIIVKRKVPKATVYQHCNYAGYAVKLSAGRYNLAALQRLGIRNDDLSAIKVPRGYKVVAFEHDNFLGRKLKLTSNNTCLVNNGFNDIISSIVIKRR